MRGRLVMRGKMAMRGKLATKGRQVAGRRLVLRFGSKLQRAIDWNRLLGSLLGHQRLNRVPKIALDRS